MWCFVNGRMLLVIGVLISNFSVEKFVLTLFSLFKKNFFYPENILLCVKITH